QVTFISTQDTSIPATLHPETPWPEADLIIDAIFGIGLTRPLDAQHVAWIERINACKLPIFSLDIPSGLHADTGIPLPIAVQATHTLTFIGLKPGLITGQGQNFCGQITIAPLSITEQHRSHLPQLGYAYRHYTPASKRAAHSHKGMCGHVLIIGGAPGYAGATLLAGLAALRSGAGMVSIATHPDHAYTLSSYAPELMIHAVATADALKPLLAQATVVALGPGLQQHEWSYALWHMAIQSCTRLVLDADGLNLLGKHPHVVLPKQTVLTPHPAEAGRLLKVTTEEITQDRLAAIQHLWERFERPVLLKGSGTLLKTEAAHYWLCTAGNPGMATAGMGDALTGIIAGLIAQSIPIEQALRDGVALHATAGDEAARAGQCGLITRDLIDWIRTCHNHPAPLT
ncbi:MAG: NAD(P)H-hydrate dehydratase, partial [Pseudomonadota bacterium]